jgi:hypothetical protein
MFDDDCHLLYYLKPLRKHLEQYIHLILYIYLCIICVYLFACVCFKYLATVVRGSDIGPFNIAYVSTDRHGCGL